MRALECGAFIRSGETSRVRRPEVDGFRDAAKKNRRVARTKKYGRIAAVGRDLTRRLVMDVARK